MANLNLPIDNTLIDSIDAARGKQPRVSWIRDAITDKLGTKRPDPIADSGQTVTVSRQMIADMGPRLDPPKATAPKSFGDHPEGTCDDPACPRFACRKRIG